MGLSYSYRTIYANIRNAHPEMSYVECKQLMTKLLDEQMKPIFSEEQMIAIFNHVLFEQGKKLIKTDKISKHSFTKEQNGDPNGRYKPGFIEQFTPKQREERRKKSQAVRHAMIDIVGTVANNESELMRTTGRSTEGVERQVFEVLLYPVDPAATPEEQERVRIYNEEVLDLFGGSKLEANLRKRREDLMQRNPGMTQEQADQAIRARRAQIVMDRYHEFTAVMDNIDALIDSDLPAETLAANTKKIFRMERAIVAIDNVLDKIPAEFTLPEEDIQMLKRLQLAQNTCAVAQERARQMTSPVFEYLDYSMVQNVNVSDFYEAINDGGEDFPDNEPWDKSAEKRRLEAEKNAPQQAAPKQEKQPEQPGKPAEENPELCEGVPKQYMRRVHDVINASFIDEIKYIDSDYRTGNLETVLASYGFTSVIDQHTHYMESDQNNQFTFSPKNDAILKHIDQPFAIESHGRYGVFTQTDNGLKVAKPEDLFNYHCSDKINALSEMMNEADPPRHRGKQAFREMRLTFEIILQASQSNRFRLDNDVNKALPRHVIEAHLKNLIKNAEEYKATKRAALDYIKSRQENALKHGRDYKLTTSENWDVRRTDMADALIAFAQTKLTELYLIDKAHATMQQYEGMSSEKRLERIAQMDAEWLQKRRDAEPIKWIQNKISSTYCDNGGLLNAIPDPLKTELKRAGSDLGNTSANDLSQRDALKYQALVGRMVAAEQIMQEDVLMHGMPGGTLRDFYVNAATPDDYIKLGAYALKKHLGRDPEDVLTPANLLSTVSHFNPKQLAADTLEFSYKERKQSGLEIKLNGLYVSSIHQTFSSVLDEYDTAVVEFAKDNIQSFRIAKHLRPDNTIAREKADKLLTDCIISSMVQKARQDRGSAMGHSELEYMLQQYPGDAGPLRHQIMNSDSYKRLIGDYFNANKSAITYENLVKIIDQKLPQQVAVTEYTQAVHLRNTLLFARLNDFLQKTGLKNPQFRTPDGVELNPLNNPNDLARVVSGEPLCAISNDPQAEFICRCGSMPPQAINASPANAIRNAANMDNPTFSKAVGSPFDITLGKQLDLNTLEGIQYVLDGNPVILSGGETQFLLRYNSATGEVAREVAPYRQIGDILNEIGFGHDVEKLTFYMPNGTPVGLDKLYDANSPEYQHIISGRPFDVTSANGHQYRITFDRDKGTATHERTAHDELVSFLEGTTLKQLRADVNKLKERNIPASPQYAKMVESLVLLDNINAPFYKEQFLDPTTSAMYTQVADELMKSADAFLNGEGTALEQSSRANIAKRISYTASLLHTFLRRENIQRLSSTFEIRQNLNEIHTVKETTGKTERVHTVDLDRREEIVAWLREYHDFLKKGGQAEQANERIAQLVNAEKLNVDDLAKQIPFNMAKYTADDLRQVKIDATVLKDEAARADFLSKETARQQDAKHLISKAGNGFTIMGKAARREAIIDWLKERVENPNSVREEFVTWVKTISPDLAEQFDNPNKDEAKEYTNAYLNKLNINPNALDYQGSRSYYVSYYTAKVDETLKKFAEERQNRAKQQTELAKKREDIVEWLRTVPHEHNPDTMFEDSDLNQDDADSIENKPAKEIKSAEVQNVAEENPPKYTKDDLKEVGIDPEVLENAEKRNAFLAAENPVPNTEPAQDISDSPMETEAYLTFNQQLDWVGNLSDLMKKLNETTLSFDKNNPLKQEKSHLNLFSERYFADLAAMSSLSRNNIATLNADLTALRTEARIILHKYENNPKIAALLEPMRGIDSFADTQLARLKAFDENLHPVRELTDAQKAMAVSEYERIKHRFIARPKGQPVDSPIAKEFYKMDSLTPDNIKKLFQKAGSTDKDILNDVSRFIYGAPADPNVPPDRGIFRKAYGQRAMALPLSEGALTAAMKPVIAELEKSSDKLIGCIETAQAGIEKFNTALTEAKELLTAFYKDIYNRKNKPDDKALRGEYLNRAKDLAKKMPAAETNGVSLHDLMQNVVNELEKPLNAYAAGNQQQTDAKLAALRGRISVVQTALNTYGSQSKMATAFLGKLRSDAQRLEEAKLQAEANPQQPQNVINELKIPPIQPLIRNDAKEPPVNKSIPQKDAFIRRSASFEMKIGDLTRPQKNIPKKAEQADNNDNIINDNGNIINENNITNVNNSKNRKIPPMEDDNTLEFNPNTDLNISMQDEPFNIDDDVINHRDDDSFSSNNEELENIIFSETVPIEKLTDFVNKDVTQDKAVIEPEPIEPEKTKFSDYLNPLISLVNTLQAQKNNDAEQELAASIRTTAYKLRSLCSAGRPYDPLKLLDLQNSISNTKSCMGTFEPTWTLEFATSLDKAKAKDLRNKLSELTAKDLLNKLSELTDQNVLHLQKADLYRAQGILRFRELNTLSAKFKTDKWANILASANQNAPQKLDLSTAARRYRAAINSLKEYVDQAALPNMIGLIQNPNICEDRMRSLTSLRQNIEAYLNLPNHTHPERVNAIRAASALMWENALALRDLQSPVSSMHDWLETHDISTEATEQMYQASLKLMQDEEAELQTELQVKPPKADNNRGLPIPDKAEPPIRRTKTFESKVIPSMEAPGRELSKNKEIPMKAVPPKLEVKAEPQKQEIKAEPQKPEIKNAPDNINVINENVIREVKDDKKIISDQEFKDMLDSGTLTSIEFKNYYLAKTQNLLEELGKFDEKQDRIFSHIHSEETSAAEKLSKDLKDSSNVEQVIKAMDTFMHNCTAFETLMNNGCRTLWHFRDFHKAITAVLPSAKTAILSNYAATLNPETDKFKRLMNGPLMNLETKKKLYQNKANNLADTLNKKDEFEKQFADQLNDVFVKGFDAPIDQLIKKLEEFVKQPEAIQDHKNLEEFTSEIKQTLLPNLRVIHTAEANPIPKPTENTLPFAEYEKRIKKRLDSLINNTSMAENDMSKLKPVLEQFRDALPADGENATVYDRYVLKENFYSLLNTVSKTGTFPEYTAFYKEQWNYVLGSSITKDKWEERTRMRDTIVPVRSKPCKSRDEKALYDKATWLSNLLTPKSNATIVALNKEIAELLASDRFHEICVTKKNEKSNQLLQKSTTMRNLAICVTLKAILLNEQTMLEGKGSGLLTQLTEKQDLAQIKSILNGNSSFKAAYKRLDNQGMYDFIMKDGYRKLSKQVVPGIYTSMKKLIEKYKLETPKDQNNIFENEADRTNEKAPKASKKITNKLP